MADIGWRRRRGSSPAARTGARQRAGLTPASASNTLSCQRETLHSQQLRSIKKSIDSDHGIYRKPKSADRDRESARMWRVARSCAKAFERLGPCSPPQKSRAPRTVWHGRRGDLRNPHRCPSDSGSARPRQLTRQRDVSAKLNQAAPGSLQCVPRGRGCQISSIG